MTFALARLVAAKVYFRNSLSFLVNMAVYRQIVSSLCGIKKLKKVTKKAKVRL